jgi:S-adenosyl-L-methionine hydrolase (adenosine-forming)
MGRIITLLTDFGLRDGYVASMKGVILGICPQVALVDISHLSPPQDIPSAAYLLHTVYHHFPDGAIHIAVVDPGVGTKRKALALLAHEQFFIGPDNGIFSWVLKSAAAWKAISLENGAYWRNPVSKTFHGRDIFAPVAAHIAQGIELDLFGPACEPHIAEWISPTRTTDGISGKIIHIDHFGNAITNISDKDLDPFATKEEYEVEVNPEISLKIIATYGHSPSMTAVALIGSSGHLEIAVNQGNAAQMIGIQSGDTILVRRRPGLHSES